MEKIFNPHIGFACIALLLFLGACKKSDNNLAAKNMASLTINGTQQKVIQVSTNVDSIGGIPYRDIKVELDGNTFFDIYLTLSSLPSLPGGLIDLTTTEGQAQGAIGYTAGNKYYYDPTFNNGTGIGTGGIHITKDDTNSKRIEGSFTGCTLTDNSNETLSTAGNFGVTY